MQLPQQQVSLQAMLCQVPASNPQVMPSTGGHLLRLSPPLSSNRTTSLDDTAYIP
jgi:hypothetical protein